MTPGYRVFVSVDVVAALRQCRSRERRAIILLLEQLSQDPYKVGDYVEADEIGRPIQVLITGRNAICFWADPSKK
jgi:hypothetical protein